MLQTMKRTLFVGSAVVVVAALCSGSALAARGHAKFGPRAAKGMPAGFGQFMGMGGFGGPAFGMKGAAFGQGFGPGFGGHGMRGHGHGFGGPGMRGPGGGGGGILATGVLKASAAYLGISLTALQTELKGGKTLAKVADGTSGKNAAGLIAALTADAKDNLAAAVAADWLTQKQADAMLERVTKEITALVNNGPAVPPEKPAGPLDAAAKYLNNMSVADLMTALKGGKSLADVAKDKNLSVDGLVTALTADAKTKLDKAVADERITQSQANAILSKLTERVTKAVNATHEPKAKTSAATTTTNSIKYALKFAVRR